jgi:hypothetical protein
MKRVTHYDNFFPEDLFKLCDEYSINLDFSIENRTIRTNRAWEKTIVKDSNPVLIGILKESDELHRQIKDFIKRKLGHTILSIMFYYWTPVSHIPWHNDGNYKGGITIYLNDQWDSSQGGLFMFKSPDGKITAIEPVRNRLVEQLGGVIHAVCPTSKDSEIRRTIQIFFNE